ncbi:hypothetical protein MASR1M74_14300 [Lentimicrobium sp.]
MFVITLQQNSRTASLQTAKITQYLMVQALDRIYEKVASGIAGLDTAPAMAAYYTSNSDSALSAAKALIRFQNFKAGSSGFITGLGGAISLPLTIPLNLASVLFIQIRMIAAIAIIGGYDLRDSKVKSASFMSSCFSPKICGKGANCSHFE